MDGKNQDRFVDELLDASLKQYRSNEPRPGLEGRLLAGVRAREGAVRQGVRTWAWALCAAAGLAAIVLIGVLPRRQRLPVPAPTPSPAPLAAAKPVGPLVGERSALPIASGQVPRAGGARPYRAARATSAERHREQFPTPRPLTKQEQLLMLYVQTVSRSATVIGANAARKDDELEIPELSVAALDPIRPLSEPEGRTEN